ncbi:MAG TPA: twitching motility protein PilT [Treponema sp.]|nr:twitching motility protein PilT [Treponema sp.]
MAFRYRITDIDKLKDRAVFFDANVLIYLFWPNPQQTWQQKYSLIYGRLLKQKNPLVVNISVLSEVINRILRIEYDNYCKKNTIQKEQFPFKSYRDTPDGIDAQKLIYDIIKEKVLSVFALSEKSITVEELKQMLLVDSLDFGDKIITLQCKEKQYILLTNDNDFLQSDIDILSANSKIFTTS